MRKRKKKNTLLFLRRINKKGRKWLQFGATFILIFSHFAIDFFHPRRTDVRLEGKRKSILHLIWTLFRSLPCPTTAKKRLLRAVIDIFLAVGYNGREGRRETMRKVVRILIAVFAPIFLGLFISSFFISNGTLQTIEYIVDAILLVLIGLELFAFKDKKEK